MKSCCARNCRQGRDCPEHEIGYEAPIPASYLPREQAQLQDRPLLVELYDDAPLLPGWALWIGVVFMVTMFYLAWVMT